MVSQMIVLFGGNAGWEKYTIGVVRLGMKMNNTIAIIMHLLLLQNIFLVVSHHIHR